MHKVITKSLRSLGNLGEVCELSEVKQRLSSLGINPIEDFLNVLIVVVL